MIYPSIFLMQKPQNYFSLLQQMQHRNLRRQYQAQLQPLQNLPDIQDLLMIAVALFPDAFEKKDGTKNITSVLGKLYRQNFHQISQQVITAAPFTAEFLQDSSESEEELLNEEKQIILSTPVKKSTPKIVAKQQTPKQLNTKNQKLKNDQNSYFQQVFDLFGPGFRTQGFGQQFTDPSLSKILLSQDLIALQYPEQIIQIQTTQDQLIAQEQFNEEAPLFIVDGVVSPVSTVFSALYYMFQQRKNPTEQVQFLQSFLSKVFYLELQNNQQILVDCNAFKSKASNLQYSENYNCELRLVNLLEIPTVVVCATRTILQGEQLFLSFHSSWIRQESILADSTIDSYRIQNLRYDLKCQNMQFQIGILTIQDGKYYQYVYNAAKNSNLKPFFKKYCELKQQSWDEIGEKNIFDNKELIDMDDQRFFYQGKIDESLVIRLCDILGYW